MAISTTPLVDISTLDAKIRKIAVPVLERRKVFDRLRKAGNIITGQTGTEISWLVDFKDHETQALDDLTYIQAPRFNTLKKATLEWVARASGSSISEMEKRDEQDSARAAAPLKPAADAVLLDTTGNTLERSTALVCALIEKRSTKR